MNARLEVKDKTVSETLKDFLREILEKKYLDALLAPMDIPGGRLSMTLVTSPEKVKYVNPLAPVMHMNAAQIISAMTGVSPNRRKVGVILRPCELRALVELAKLKQASLENLVLISIDCLGTFPAKDYQERSKEPEFVDRHWRSPSLDPGIRQACQVCEYPIPLNAHIQIGLVGMNIARGLLIQASGPEAEDIVKGLGLKNCTEEELNKREQVLAKLKTTRIEAKDKFFEQLQSEVVGQDKLLSVLAPCIGCHNCRVMCPICYCKECFFDSATFESGAEEYLTWAEKKGALKMPNDTLLFHLTRLNHMAVSCVGCGMCQEACPHDIPVFNIFRLVGAQLQQQFEYVPGKNIEEEPPLTVFREDELGEIGK